MPLAPATRVVAATNRRGRRSRQEEEGALGPGSRVQGPEGKSRQKSGRNEHVLSASQAGALEKLSRQEAGAASASRALIGCPHLKQDEPASRSRPRIDKPQPIPRPTRGINLDPVLNFYTTTTLQGEGRAPPPLPVKSCTNTKH
ncbi:hypothetical protein P3342_010994 [Pyrenophora teres f. teres]|nr:hypothetical protein P3342_010994 [Pyrenophora teres f. teres]